MISTKATENYVSIMANKWNDELYIKNSLELYNKQFQKSKSITSESTSDSINKINIITQIFHEVKTYVNSTYSRPNEHIDRIFRDRLEMYYNIMYSELQQAKVFYKVVDKPQPIRKQQEIKKVITFIKPVSDALQNIVITPETAKNAKLLIPTPWKLSKVSTEEFEKNETDLQHYKNLERDMYEKFEKFQTSKRSLESLEVVIKHKAVERQLNEYTIELEDSKQRLELHEKIKNDEVRGIYKFKKAEHHVKVLPDKIHYQVKLQSALKELIRYTEESLEVTKYKMENNIEYKELTKEVDSYKTSYTLARRKLTDARKKFFKFRVAPKTALWKNNNVVSGLHWYPIKDIRYTKIFDKVTFDYETRKLTLH